MSAPKEEIYVLREMHHVKQPNKVPTNYNEKCRSNQNVYPATVGASDSNIIVIKNSANWRCVSIILVSVVAVVSLVVVTGMVFAVRRNDNTAPISEWGHWTECDVTCGLGSKTRTRECHPPPELCIGSDSQVTNCYEQDCPTIVYGQWDIWASWSMCSVSCGGGTQNKRRICKKLHADLKDCIGSDIFTRNCSLWKCPTCDMICTNNGTLTQPCERCKCSGSMFSGRVISHNYLPLEKVKVVDANIPSVTLAKSDEDGKFTIHDACMFTEVTLIAKGYLELNHTIMSLGGKPVDISLEKIEPLQIKEHPSDKVLVIGDTFTLCCSVSGNPGPSYYEWFFDNNLINPDIYNYSNSMTIFNVVRNNAGYYRCRGSNDNDAVYSELAKVTVTDSTQESCPKSPVKYEEELPHGCTHNGKKVFNAGKCARSLCHSENSIGCWPMNQSRCCGAVQYSHITAKCIGHKMTIPYISSCGCTQCFDRSLIVQGKTVDKDSNEPVPDAYISLNGLKITKTDKKGNFKFETPIHVNQLSIRAQHAKSEYLDANKMVYINKEFSAATQVYIKMHKKGKKQPGKSTKDNVFTVESTDHPFAEIFIPANSLLATNGNKYTGDFNAVINAIDPRDISEFLSLPADLFYRDGLGNLQRLKSYGMFGLSLESANSELLQLKDKFQVALYIPLFNDVISPRVSILNANTGLWEFHANLVVAENKTYPSWRKNHFTSSSYMGSVIIGDVEYDIDRTWFDFDSNPEIACHSKVRVFKDNNFIFDEQVDGAIITYLSHNEIDGAIEAASIRSYSDGNDENGYCMVHTCDWMIDNKKGYHGYIIAESSSSNPDRTPRFIPATYPELVMLGFPEDTLDGIRYNSVVDQQTGYHAAYARFDYTYAPYGPFYKWDGNWAYSPACSAASVSSPFFAFYGSAVPDYCPQAFYVQEEVVIGGDKQSNCLSWFPTSIESVYEVCYLKALVSNWNEKDVQALSAVGNSTCGGEIQPGDVCGVTYDCPKGDQEAAVCLEIKRGGYITDGDGNIYDDETIVTVQPVNADGSLGNCVVSEIRQCLSDAYGSKIISNINDQSFKMYLEGSNTPFGRDFGIHCVDKNQRVENKDMAREMAEGYCQEVHSPTTCSSDDPEGISWAVKFECI